MYVWDRPIGTASGAWGLHLGGSGVGCKAGSITGGTDVCRDVRCKREPGLEVAGLYWQCYISLSSKQTREDVALIADVSWHDVSGTVRMRLPQTIRSAQVELTGGRGCKPLLAVSVMQKWP